MAQADWLRSSASTASADDEVDQWIRAQRELNDMAVERVDLTDLGPWGLTGNPLVLAHASGAFFTVEGAAWRSGDETRPLHQPIINQAEVGLLGFLVQRSEDAVRFLVQAKNEPGNVGGVQISPTLQATYSNYARAHGGHHSAYLANFLGDGASRLVDSVQPEQTAFFLGKVNRNLIVDDPGAPLASPCFRWLTLGQLARLAREDFVLSMDSRSVLSCITASVLASCVGADWCGALGESARTAETDVAVIRDWLARCADREYHRVGLDELSGWTIDATAIAPGEGAEHPFRFRVVGIQAHGGNREVAAWKQPIIECEGPGLLGVLCQRGHDGIVRFLVRVQHEVGATKGPLIGPTVASYNSETHHPPRMAFFHPAPAGTLRHSQRYSEEGGRFLEFVSSYMVVEAGDDDDLPPDADERWLTLGDIDGCLRAGLVSIELRNVIACLLGSLP